MKYFSLGVAIAATVFAVPAARAEMACYMELAERQIDLTAVCDGSQLQSSIAIPEFQPSLFTYGMQNAQIWQAGQWQPSQQVSLQVVNLGEAAANNVTVVVQGERHNAMGQVEAVETQTVTLTEVPARVSGQLNIEFSFIPDDCRLVSIDWN